MELKCKIKKNLEEIEKELRKWERKMYFIPWDSFCRFDN